MVLSLESNFCRGMVAAKNTRASSANLTACRLKRYHAYRFIHQWTSPKESSAFVCLDVGHLLRQSPVMLYFVVRGEGDCLRMQECAGSWQRPFKWSCFLLLFHVMWIVQKCPCTSWAFLVLLLETLHCFAWEARPCINLTCWFPLLPAAIGMVWQTFRTCVHVLEHVTLSSITLLVTMTMVFISGELDMTPWVRGMTGG